MGLPPREHIVLDCIMGVGQVKSSRVRGSMLLHVPQTPAPDVLPHDFGMQ